MSSARSVLDACYVFYADRLSEAILSAMEMAADARAIVYFEPSNVDDQTLFERALKLTTILKFSSDRVSDNVIKSFLHRDSFSIITHGADGLEVRQGMESVWCRAIPTSVVRDTCGSGDMVSIGVIDWILKHRIQGFDNGSLEHLLVGVAAGQRLAAINCAFEGARGVFQRHGPQFARMVLDDDLCDALSQFDLFD